jgi:hypothetical protein
MATTATAGLHVDVHGASSVTHQPLRYTPPLPLYLAAETMWACLAVGFLPLAGGMRDSRTCVRTPMAVPPAGQWSGDGIGAGKLYIGEGTPARERAPRPRALPIDGNGAVNARSSVGWHVAVGGMGK